VPQLRGNAFDIFREFLFLLIVRMQNITRPAR
jgi:hypothetical protein